MSSQKGNGFERDACRQLSLWWSGDKEDDLFWRNKLRRTTKAYNAQMQLGDIVAVDERGHKLTKHFVIECKNGYSISRTKKGKSTKSNGGQKVRNVPWDALDLIDGRGEKSLIFTFWEQALEEAQISGKIPILIVKRDFHKPIIAFSGAALDIFQSPALSWMLIQMRRQKGIPAKRLCIFSLEEFCKVYDPDDLMTLIKRGPNDKIIID